MKTRFLPRFLDGYLVLKMWFQCSVLFIFLDLDVASADEELSAQPVDEDRTEDQVHSLTLPK